MDGLTLEKLKIDLHATEMSDHDLSTAKKAFGLFSNFSKKEHMNLLSERNLALALRAMRLIPSEAQIKGYIKEYFDAEGIDEKTFYEIAKDCWIDEGSMLNAVWNAFSVFDEIQSGYLTAEVMQDILLKYGEPIDKDDAQLILKKNINKNFLLPYANLINQWKKINIFPGRKTNESKRNTVKGKQK